MAVPLRPGVPAMELFRFAKSRPGRAGLSVSTESRPILTILEIAEIIHPWHDPCLAPIHFTRSLMRTAAR